MKRKKNSLLLPAALFGLVLILSMGALALSQNLRKAEIAQPGEYTTQDEIPRVTVEEAYQAVLDGKAVLVDTRSETEYQGQRAAGAISIPVDQTESQLDQLDPDIWYLTYCT